MSLTPVAEIEDLDIDDDGLYTEDVVTTMDGTHQFVNFSRKVTEASSMRKPVDIQLGIASGKGFFSQSSPSMWVTKRQQRNHSPREERLVQWFNSSGTVSAADMDEERGQSSVTPALIITDEDDSSSSTSISTAFNDAIIQHDNNTALEDNSGSTLAPHSLLLEQLISDVLNHIESCPDKTAYSMDLDRLKPKLKAYNSNKELS